jgi:hypothetical protein
LEWLRLMLKSLWIKMDLFLKKFIWIILNRLKADRMLDKEK